jgi:putative nucleotidyltransferase with HDIG domain
MDTPVTRPVPAHSGTPAPEGVQPPLREYDLPPLSPVADAVLRLVGRDDVGLAELSEVVATDAALATELLAVANSAFAGARGRVSSINQAAAILGFKRIAGIAAAVALRSYVGPLSQTSTVRACWLHNLATALSAEHMARALQLDAQVAYTAGLLHDVGRLALIAKFGGEYLRMLRGPTPEDGTFHAQELARFGITHSEAGRLLLERLGLPMMLSNAAALHHTPPAADAADAVVFVRAACRVANAIGFAVVGRRDAGQAPDPDSVTLNPLFEELPLRYQRELVAQRGLARSVRRLVEAYQRALS